MDFYFYGNSGAATNFTDIGNAMDMLSENLNKHDHQAKGPEGKTYPVQFVVAGHMITEQQAIQYTQENVGELYSPRTNFVRVEDNVSTATNSRMKNLKTNEDGEVVPEVSSLARLGTDNSILVSPEHLKSKTFTHEVVAHGFAGRSFRSGGHIFDWTDNPHYTIPSIRTVKFTKNLPSSYSEIATINGRTGIVMKKEYLEKREVLPADT